MNATECTIVSGCLSSHIHPYTQVTYQIMCVSKLHVKLILNSYASELCPPNTASGAAAGKTHFNMQNNSRS